MTKEKQIYFCKECGYEAGKWLGQCPACGEWNTFVEAPKATKASAGRSAARGLSYGAAGAKPISLSEIADHEDNRIITGIGEFDRVLGGGIIRGSLILIGGDPGIGKSTLLTQVCKAVSDSGSKVLYISGEESARQIKLRANRLGSFNDNMKLLCETDIDLAGQAVPEENPAVMVIDSIQTVYSDNVDSTPGSPSQIRECAHVLMELAKANGIAVFIVGHVTKEGVVAGPRMLEHMVDTVIYFEGDGQGAFRILRTVKNRFGPTNEIGVFDMREGGLFEVKNPSEYMLKGRPEHTPGTTISCSVEGTRPVLIEIQALVCKTSFGNPRRSATGMDHGRLNMILAVLERRLQLKLSECDAYVNIVGGLRVNETAIDLAVAIAVTSALMEFEVRADAIAIGEVGLTGEIRSVGRMKERILEASKMGFKTCIVPAASVDALKKTLGSKELSEVRLVPVMNIQEAVRAAKN